MKVRGDCKLNKIIVTRQIPQKFISQLEDIAEVVVWNESLIPMPRDKFLAEVQDAIACFITLSETIDETCLANAPHLKVIANMAVGYDNIDVNIAKQKGIIVTNTPEVLTETTAELGFTLMLATARRIVEAEKYVQDGQWKSWGHIYCQEKMSMDQQLVYSEWETLEKHLPND